MSVRTSAMTHFNIAAEGFVTLEQKAGELANSIYTGLCTLADECVNESLLAEYDKAMIDAEAHVKAQLPDGVTLSSYSGTWKKTKSQLRRGIKAGVDPKDHKTRGAFLKATDEITGGNSLGKTKAIPTKNPDSKGDKSKSTIAEVTTGNKLSKTASERLHSMIRELEKLPESEQVAVLTNCEGAIRSKLKKVARLSNLKTA